MATTILETHDLSCGTRGCRAHQGDDVLLVIGTIDGVAEPTYGDGHELRREEHPVIDPATHQPVVDDDGVIQTRWTDVAYPVRVLLPEEEWPLKKLAATGWVSGLMTMEPAHYAGHPETPDVGAEGQAPCGCIPREMTPDEKLAYCKRLLEAQNPVPAPPVILGIRG